MSSLKVTGAEVGGHITCEERGALMPCFPVPLSQTLLR